MRRLVGIAAVLLAGIGWLALSAAAGGGDSGRYRVDAVFDNASFLIPGQDVKIAGARVGKVVDVRLTPGRHARVQLEVDRRFAPFRADADCTILPQSLIGERFVQCVPGTPAAPPLRGRAEQAPTVPLAQTHAPVDLDVILASLGRPERERLRILLNELGVGLAARGPALNAAIRRAAPALQQTERVLSVLDGERAALRRLVADSERVVGELARRPHGLGDAIGSGAAVLRRTARRRAELRRTVAALPALLDEADPALDRLRDLAVGSTPLLGDLQRAGAPLRELAGRVGPLAGAARPTLRRLTDTAALGRATLREGAPVVRRLRRFAREARPTGALLADLVVSLRERGAVEGLQRFVFYAALATSRYDRYSHILPAHLLGTECSGYATEPVPGCSARFGGDR